VPIKSDDSDCFAALACAGETDTDSDGLTDHEEAALGTDPTEADTDGDGVDDGAEVSDGTDPLNGFSYAFANGGYPVGDCQVTPADLVGVAIGPT
jgi:hypothetical protein